MADLSDFSGDETGEGEGEESVEESEPESTIEDYLTGKEIEESAEHRLRNRYIEHLVEDRGFPEDALHTVPEWRVKPRPSTPRNSSEAHRPDFVYFDAPENYFDVDHVHTVGETKTTETYPDAHRRAREQVKEYLQNEPQANYGIAVSDEEDPFKVTVWVKQTDESGQTSYVDVDIEPPAPGQDVSVPVETTVGDLEPLDNPKEVTKRIRDYVHSNDTSATDDISMAKQWSYMILTKLADEDRDSDAEPKLKIEKGDSAEDIADDVDEVFKRRVVPAHSELFGSGADPDNWEIEFDPDTKRYIVQELQEASLSETSSLIMRDAFEEFITYAVKGDEGQFYTRRNLCAGMAKALSPSPREYIGDLAAGTGGLVLSPIEIVEQKLKSDAMATGQPERYSLDLATYIENYVYAVDKAHFAVDLMTAELEASYQSTPTIEQGDSLSYDRWDDDPLPAGRFDLLFANFPYGSGLTKSDPSLLREYDLGYEWEGNDEDDGPKELGDVQGVGPSTLEDLREAGIENIVDLNEADIEDLQEIGGIGEKTAEKMQADISEEDIEEFRGEDDGDEERFSKTTDIRDEQEISILFLELYHKMLDDGGRTAIVFPETHLVSDDYVGYWLRRNFRVHGVWDLPDEMFQPHTHAKMVVLFLEKVADGNPQNEDYPIFMGTVEKVGHNQRGDPIYKLDEDGEPIRDESGHKIPKDHIPDMADVTLDWFSKAKEFVEGASADREYFDAPDADPDLSETDLTDGQVSVIQNSDIQDDLLIPRVYQERWVERAREWAEEHDCELVQLQTLIDEGAVETFRGHGGIESEWFGFDKEVPYIHTSRINGLEIDSDDQHVKKVDLEIHENKSEKIEIQPRDILLVRRGDYRIGNVGIVYESQTPLLSVAENEIIRVNEPNDYDLSAEVLLYLLSQDIVTDQLKPFRQYETIIWNVSDRYQEVYLPIPNDEEFRDEIEEAVEKRAEGFETLTEDLTQKVERLESGEEEEEESEDGANAARMKE